MSQPPHRAVLTCSQIFIDNSTGTTQPPYCKCLPPSAESLGDSHDNSLMLRQACIAQALGQVAAQGRCWFLLAGLGCTEAHCPPLLTVTSKGFTACWLPLSQLPLMV